jgi:hypothetical protein
MNLDGIIIYSSTRCLVFVFHQALMTEYNILEKGMCLYMYKDGERCEKVISWLGHLD